MPIPLDCPLCRQPLQRERASWHCAGGHAFDVAREGYVNLLPVQHKKSRAPGDSPEMLRARREFLDAGHYAPLRAAMTALLAPLAAREIVDIGCGEGYYTAVLAGEAPAANGEAVTGPGPADGAGGPPGEVIGIDIARDAVQRAARRYPGVTWLVASSASLPLASASCDLATSLFAPVPAAEIARVLRVGGHLLVVTPGADHLLSLREALFEDVRAHDPEKILTALANDFRLVERRDVGFPLALDQPALAQLLLMTPYAWRAKRERSEALAANVSFATTAAFRLFLLERS